MSADQENKSSTTKEHPFDSSFASSESLRAGSGAQRRSGTILKNHLLNLTPIEAESLKSTPIWDDLGWGGIPREGRGYQDRVIPVIGKTESATCDELRELESEL